MCKPAKALLQAVLKGGTDYSFRSFDRIYESRLVGRFDTVFISHCYLPTADEDHSLGILFFKGDRALPHLVYIDLLEDPEGIRFEFNRMRSEPGSSARASQHFDQLRIKDVEEINEVLQIILGDSSLENSIVPISPDEGVREFLQLCPDY